MATGERASDHLLDPFLGSTLIAAAKAARVCRGLELDPLYVDVIIRRYEAYSGKLAIFLETGETFEALAMRRVVNCAVPNAAANGEGEIRDVSPPGGDG